MFLKWGENIFLKELQKKTFKDVKNFYGITEVEKDSICTINGLVSIYELKPCLILEGDEQLDNIFYEAYIRNIKMLKVDYQIVIDTKKFKLDDTFNALDNTQYKMKSQKQKNVVNKYKEYLKELSDDIEIYERCIYLIIKKLDDVGERQLTEALTNLKAIGIGVRKVESREEILRIIYELINKSEGE